MRIASGMQNRCLLILIGLLMGVPGCALKPALPARKTPVPPNTALVYFNRPRSNVGATISMDVQDNAIDLGTLSNGTYFLYHANPGVHTFTLTTNTTAFQTLKLQGGMTYYVRVSIERVGMNYRPHLEVVFDLQGQSAIHNLQRLNYGE